MDNMVLRRPLVERSGKRPVTFYLGYRRPGGADKTMMSSQYRRSLSNMTINESAMLSCWKKVHGGAHDLEKRKSEPVIIESELEAKGRRSISNEVLNEAYKNNSNINNSSFIAKVVEKEPKPKTVASRQSSYPGLRQRALIQNEAKRLSMPLPVLYRKEMAHRQLEELEKAGETVKVEAVTDAVRKGLPDT